MSNIFNVKSYGAKGDGTTDDTASIQSALNAAASSSGSVVYLPPGTYIVSPVTGINVSSNTTLRGSGPSSILKIASGVNATGNLVKAESVSNVSYDSFTIDGNSANQSSGTNYGAYFGTVTGGTITNLVVKNCTGVGIHVYNSTNVKVRDNWSTGNTYHGFEAEQCSASIWQGNRGCSNTLHGIIINPGEVGGTGSYGLSVVDNICDSNSQYGIAVGVANGSLGEHFTRDCIIANNVIRSNAQYGIQIYKQNRFTITGNNISNNGFFGIYVYESRYNAIMNNYLHNNSQASSGGYDEILIEGSADGYASTNNIVSGNTIIIDGTTKARYAINVGTSGDSANIFTDNNILNAGTLGKINQLGTNIV